MKDDLFEAWTSIYLILEPFRANRAFILDDVEFTNFASRYDIFCEIFVHPGKYVPTLSYSTYAYQKNFPLKEILDYHINKMKQSGILHKLGRKYFPPLIQDCETPLKEIDIRGTIFTFSVFSAGVVSSILIFSSEKLLSFCPRKTTY